MALSIFLAFFSWVVATTSVDRPRQMMFWVRRGNGQVLLRQRPEKGLLGGMMEIPSTDWRDKKWNPSEAAMVAPFTAAWHPLEGIVRHTFTHFHLELTVLAAYPQLRREGLLR